MVSGDGRGEDEAVVGPSLPAEDDDDEPLVGPPVPLNAGGEDDGRAGPHLNGHGEGMEAEDDESDPYSLPVSHQVSLQGENELWVCSADCVDWQFALPTLP